MKPPSFPVHSGVYWGLLLMVTVTWAVVLAASVELGSHVRASIESVVKKLDGVIAGPDLPPAGSLPAKIVEMVGSYVQGSESATVVGIWWVLWSVAVIYVALAIVLFSRGSRIVRASVMGLLATSTAISVFGASLMHSLRLKTEALRSGVHLTGMVAEFLYHSYIENLKTVFADVDAGFRTLENDVRVIMAGLLGMVILQAGWMILIGVMDSREDVAPEHGDPSALGYRPIKEDVETGTVQAITGIPGNQAQASLIPRA